LRSWTTIAAVAVGLVIGVAPASAATNLIKNGSFERPVVPVGSFELFGSGSSFSHWDVLGGPGNVSVVSGSFTQNGFSFPAKGGAQWLDLTGDTDTATVVSQTVQTTPGEQYTLSFSVGNVHDPGGVFGTTSTVDVYAGENHLITATNSRGSGSTTMAWKKFATTFAAVGSTTTLLFQNSDPPNDSANGLDAVKLVPAA